jgi:hypothetical protein
VAGVDEPTGRVKEGLPASDTAGGASQNAASARGIDCGSGGALSPNPFRIELRARSDYGTPTDPQV